MARISIKDLARSYPFLAVFLMVLAASLFFTYFSMYVKEKRAANIPLNTPSLDALEAKYNNEKTTIQGYLAAADQAIADLDAKGPATPNEPLLTDCVRAHYTQVPIANPTDLPTAPIEVSREMDQECVDEKYRLATIEAERRDRDIGNRRVELTTEKAELEAYLGQARTNFTSDRVHIVADARRQATQNDFITKFPVAFGVMSLIAGFAYFVYRKLA
ncbi:MAG: hypothetical protein ABI999_03805 [Acidobacteriota bacterium]